MKSIRYGILGTGLNAKKAIAVLTTIAGSEVSAIAGREALDAKYLAQKWQIPRAFKSYEEVCQSPDVDVVFIPQENRGHYACAKLALENGKHVVMEAPFTRHQVGASELFMLAQNKGLFLMEAQVGLFNPLFAKLKAVLEAGEIGQVKLVELKASASLPKDEQWQKDLAAGGGALNILGSSQINLLTYLLGQEVTAYNGLDYNQVGAADDYSVLNLKAGAVLANVTLSIDFAVANEMKIYGNEGQIIVKDTVFGDNAIIQKTNTKKRLLAKGQENAAQAMFKAINAAILAGQTESEILTGQMTQSALKLIESTYQAWYGDPLN